MRYWLTLFSWLITFQWRKGSARYSLGQPWDGYVVDWIKALAWPHGSGSVSWWRFAKALRFIIDSGAAYLPDPGETDTWYTPAEFYARGGGDCEDWASAILAKAVEFGCAPDALGWLYLLDAQGNGHIMAAMWDGDDLWLADNNRKIPDRASRILETEWAGYDVVAWFNDLEARAVACSQLSGPFCGHSCNFNSHSPEEQWLN